VSSRKYAARSLAQIAPKEVKEYVENNILGVWKKLTRSFTSNSAERWNRKLEKCFRGRYGIKTPESAKVLLRSLWFQESMMSGQRHLDDLNEFTAQKIAEACQETLLCLENLHFLEERKSPDLKKAA
jgi:hypothetical protein